MDRKHSTSVTALTKSASEDVDGIANPGCDERLSQDFSLKLNGSAKACGCEHERDCPSEERKTTHITDKTNLYRTNSIPLSLMNGKSGNSWTLDKSEKRSLPHRWLRQRAERSFTKKMLYRRVPILDWLPKYTAKAAVSDLVAGLTVGLTVIPQAIAYASVGGLPPQYGLYSAFMACFVYTIFGTSKVTSIGPTAIVAILTKQNLHGLGPQFAVLLSFLSGCVITLMGMLQLGFLIDFISGPVLAGFTTAAAFVIATSQVKDVLGLSVPGSDFIHNWDNIFQHITETRLWDTVLGAVCIAVLLILRQIKDVKKGPSTLVQVLQFISTARNILVVMISALAAYTFQVYGYKPFALSSTVKAGLPPFGPPPFTATVNNKTYTFVEMASSLGSAVLVVPLISILENISLVKIYSEGKAVDGTQEMIALGLCNIASSFVSSMPVTGALSRGAVNHASGVQTTFGGIYTGAIVLLALQFLTPYLSFIPKASLAAVIIAAVIFMVEFHVIKPMWRTKKTDLIPACATFLSCLLISLELGIVIGISINVLFLLYASARPSVDVQTQKSANGCDYLRITPDRSLVFPSVEYVRNVVSKAGIKQGSSSVPVILDCKHVQVADFTAAKGIKCLIDDFHSRGQPILFVNLKPSLVDMFQSVGPKNFRYSNTDSQLNDLLKEYSTCSIGSHNCPTSK